VLREGGDLQYEKTEENRKEKEETSSAKYGCFKAKLHALEEKPPQLAA
jgi:hypothetical protein